MTILPILAHLAIATAPAIPAPTQVPAGTRAPASAQQVETEADFDNGPLGKQYVEIEESIRCNCGCGLDVHRCQFQMQCGTSPKWAARIRREMTAGKTPDEIRAGFVADFGGSVLMAPPAEGFNLVGYLLPGFAILGAGVLVGLVAKGGGMRRRPLAPIGEISDEDEARLAEELRRLEEAESPDW